MGVAKLLRYLEFGRIRLRVREFATDKKIAVEGYVWAHEFTAQSARAVLIDRAIAPVIEAFVWRCKRWLQQGIDILVVFDGLKPPIKGTTTTAPRKPGEVGRIVSIHNWECGASSEGCKGRNQEDGCIHLSALCQAVQNLDRPEVPGALMVPTSKLCKWNYPGGDADPDLVERTIDRLPVIKPKRLAEKHGTRIMLNENLSRLIFVPLRPADLADTQQRDGNATRKIKRAAFFATLKSEDGRSCAAEEMWC